MRGRFITLEGGEGAGKSTLARALAEHLRGRGVEVVTTREPGGSPGAEAIRALVVQGAVDAWRADTEALLFMTARYDHLQSLILPALARGAWVISDRFYDSTYVYQAIAKEVGADWLDALYRLLYANLAPDLTLLLDLPPEVGLARAGARGNVAESRFEQMGIAYHTRLREAFLARARAEPQRFTVVEASAPLAVVQAAGIRAVDQLF